MRSPVKILEQETRVLNGMGVRKLRTLPRKINQPNKREFKKEDIKAIYETFYSI